MKHFWVYNIQDISVDIYKNEYCIEVLPKLRKEKKTERVTKVDWN